MIYIMLSIFGIVGTLGIRSTWSQKKQSIFVLSILVLGLVLFLVIYFTLEEIGVIEKDGFSIMAKIPWQEIGLYFIMIAGMAAKYIYDWIGSGKGQQRKFRKWQLFKPMFVSPIIFGTIYGTVDQNTSIILLLIFSFQNGFFWQSVLGKHDDK